MSALGDYKIKRTCPYGHTCEKIIPETKTIERCTHWQMIKGTDAQGKTHDDWGCSLGDWQPILFLEMSRQINSVAVAVESLRNIVANQETAILGANQVLRQLTGDFKQ